MSSKGKILLGPEDGHRECWHTDYRHLEGPDSQVMCACGSTEFKVFSPPSCYETYVVCVKCGDNGIVHSG
jgi:hypothetical protein